MVKEFVPYEIALAMKELGFKDKCSAVYYCSSFMGYPTPTLCTVGDNHTKEGLPTNDNPFVAMPECGAAPTYRQALRWFAAEFGYEGSVTPYLEYTDTSIETDGTYSFHIFKDMKLKADGSDFESSEEAEIACLNKLIKIARKEKGNG